MSSNRPFSTPAIGRLTRRALLTAAGQAAVAGSALAQGIGATEPGLPLRRLAASRGLVYGAAILAGLFPKDRTYEALAARECGLFACSRAHWDEIAPTPDKALYELIDLDYAW